MTTEVDGVEEILVELLETKYDALIEGNNRCRSIADDKRLDSLEKSLRQDLSQLEGELDAWAKNLDTENVRGRLLIPSQQLKDISDVFEIPTLVRGCLDSPELVLEAAEFAKQLVISNEDGMLLVLLKNIADGMWEVNDHLRSVINHQTPLANCYSARVLMHKLVATLLSANQTVDEPQFQSINSVDISQSYLSSPSSVHSSSGDGAVDDFRNHVTTCLDRISRYQALCQNTSQYRTASGSTTKTVRQHTAAWLGHQVSPCLRKSADKSATQPGSIPLGSSSQVSGDYRAAMAEQYVASTRSSLEERIDWKGARAADSCTLLVLPLEVFVAFHTGSDSHSSQVFNETPLARTTSLRYLIFLTCALQYGSTHLTFCVVNKVYMIQ